MIPSCSHKNSYKYYSHALIYIYIHCMVDTDIITQCTVIIIIVRLKLNPSWCYSNGRVIPPHPAQNNITCTNCSAYSRKIINANETCSSKFI